jgi:glycine cleavage system H lipoate-binding protein
MVALLVALTILGFLALDYFVLRPRRRAAEAADAAPLGLVPVTRAIDSMPNGVFLQPTYTWSRVLADGDLAMGVHPLLLGLVGGPLEIELLKNGERVEKGAPFVSLRKQDRRLTVRSPVSGTVTDVNEAPSGSPVWNGAVGPEGNWLYRVRPDRLAQEIPFWLIADQARDWTRRQYERIRNHLLAAVGGGEIGVTMTDGGDIAVGILDNLDAGVWDAFEHRFLNA